MTRAKSGGGGSSAASGAVCGTRVTSVLLRFATIVVSNWPALSVSNAHVSTTSTPRRLGVDAVDEEASAADADEALALEVLAHVVLREVLGEDDAIVDVDLIGVDRERHVGESHDGAERVVHGFLGIEILRAERASDRVLTGNDVMSYGMPAMKFVEVVAKNCCCRDGARKPVCAEPRSAKASVKS